jgi:hypothetical protein
MFFKRIATIGIALSSALIVVLSLTGRVSISDFSLPLVNSEPKSVLTGIPGKNGPVLVVKIDDTTFAHPQVGLRDADVVYVEQVEGGLTRLAAVFSSRIPQTVGPVRSARISDLELLSQYGRVGFAYSGAQRKFLPEIAAANLVDVGANKYGAAFYKNDPQRTPPYAMMLDTPALLEEVSARGESLVEAKAMGWKFGDASDLATEVSRVDISWPAARYSAQWSESERRWLLTHNGVADLDETGYHLGPANLLIQIVSITDSIYKDKVGGVTPFSATVGSGECFLLRDGKSVPCRWNRPASESGTTFSDINGDELFFAPGQIWFALTSKAPVITAQEVQDATKTMSK